MALNDGERCVRLRRGAGVLLCFAEVRVLIRAADPGHFDLHQQGAVFERRVGELLDLIRRRSGQDSSLDAGHFPPFYQRDGGAVTVQQASEGREERDRFPACSKESTPCLAVTC